jgi:predicted RND superfamily exporter protein
MYSQGWEIGVSESLSMVMMIGFSVDYVVHLSADYMHSAHKSRHDRMKQSYGEMGISIFSGSVTTFGSGVFLFGGKVILFNKFALLITVTVFFSLLSAFCLFGAIMHTFGPEEGFGDIKNITKCFKKTKE